jgi:hypothetical protein
MLDLTLPLLATFERDVHIRKRTPGSAGRHRRAVRCDVAAPAIPGGKLVSFTGRKLETASENPKPSPGIGSISGLMRDLTLPLLSTFEREISTPKVDKLQKEKAWQRRAPSQGRRRCGSFCYHWGVAPAITRAKLLRNGLGNVAFDGR